MDFEWDKLKNITNIRKHGVSFIEAISARRATKKDINSYNSFL